ncbi:MerR family transcriptional regulator [Nonomuraea pusilla]|uniref:helix-turn-helix domain-containing protein n=1 Tax=Nonomuraea pusilla TaxID=46177 RepID=UPI003323ABAC
MKSTGETGTGEPNSRRPGTGETGAGRPGTGRPATGELDSGEMGIGEVAGRFGLATHVLRHWEAVGLLAPARAAGGRRRYTGDDLYRVAMILRAKEAGFALDEIREMIAAPGEAARRAVLSRRRAELVERIARVRASLELIDCALECGHDDLATCPHFRDAVARRVALPA